MAIQTTETIQSPCIGVCAIDDLTGLCHGCYRTLDEIQGWWDMNMSEQQSLLATIEVRQIEMTDFGD